MISVEPTTDADYIKSVFLNPTIYKQMSDDACPSADALDLSALMNLPGFFLRAVIDGEDAGAFWLLWKGDSVEAHTALLENCRGRNAIRMTKSAISWVFDHTHAQSITSYAWSDSPAVAWFCRAVGMHETNEEPWPSTRNGLPVSIRYFSIPKPTQSCQ